MTPQEHNKFLGIAHLVYSGFHMFLALMFSGFFALMIALMPTGPGPDAPPTFLFLFLAAFFFLFYLIMTAP